MSNLPPGVTQSMIDGPTRKADPTLIDWYAYGGKSYDNAIGDAYADEAGELDEALSTMDVEQLKKIRDRINTRMMESLADEIKTGTGWVAAWFNE